VLKSFCLSCLGGKLSYCGAEVTQSQWHWLEDCARPRFVSLQGDHSAVPLDRMWFLKATFISGTLSEVGYHPPQTLVFSSCPDQEGSTCACETVLEIIQLFSCDERLLNQTT